MHLLQACGGDLACLTYLHGGACVFLTSFTPKPGTSFRFLVSNEMNLSCHVLKTNVNLIAELN